MYGLGLALWFTGFLGHFERNPGEEERVASDLIELSTRQNFASWLAGGEVLRGWARCALGDTAQGIPWMSGGMLLRPPQGQHRRSTRSGPKFRPTVYSWIPE